MLKKDFVKGAIAATALTAAFVIGGAPAFADVLSVSGTDLGSGRITWLELIFGW